MNFILAAWICIFMGCEKPHQDISTAVSKKVVIENKKESQEKQKANEGKLLATNSSLESSLAVNFKPFYIYENKGSRINHYVPSGFMPDGKCINFEDNWAKNCHTGETCIQVTYDLECSRKGAKWAGVYWLNPPNNWGKRKGGFNLTGAKSLKFWARGEKGGEQIQEFTVGGITGDYPDTDTAVLGPIILSQEWREYTVDLLGKDLSYISGGFAWTTSEDVNPESCVFYLDDVRFE